MQNPKSFRIVLAIAVLLGGITLLKEMQSAYAADGKNRICVVDVQRILAESAAGKAAKVELEAQAKKREGALGTKKSEIDKLKSELISQGSILSASATEEKRIQIQRLTEDFEREVKNQREDLMRQSGGVVSKIVGDVKEIVKRVATEGGFEFALEKDPRVVVYASDQIDITDRVLHELDSKRTGK